VEGCDEFAQGVFWCDEFAQGVLTGAQEYLQAKQGYERKLERIAYHNRKAEQALRQAQWNENKGAREAERKQRDIRMAAVAAGCQVFVGGLSQRCTEDDLW
jgi:hypothetical protein